MTDNVIQIKLGMFSIDYIIISNTSSVEPSFTASSVRACTTLGVQRQTFWLIKYVILYSEIIN